MPVWLTVKFWLQNQVFLATACSLHIRYDLSFFVVQAFKAVEALVTLLGKGNGVRVGVVVLVLEVQALLFLRHRAALGIQLFKRNPVRV